MSNQLKSFLFATGLCVICAFLLTAASTGLKRYHQKNIALDMHKNILKSVGLIDDNTNYSPEHIEKLYADAIKSVSVDKNGKIINEGEHCKKCLPIYLHIIQDEIESYVIPIETQGLWGKIFGYLAINNDGTTIKGFTVYKHSETPGLGGEIEKKWFQKNFEDKRIADLQGHFVSISIAKGATKEMPSKKQEHYVDGISGATLTGKFLSAGLKEILAEYEPISIKFRKHELKKLR